MSNLQAINVTSYIQMHHFEIPSRNYVMTSISQKNYTKAFKFIDQLHKIDSSINGIAMELLVSFCLDDNYVRDPDAITMLPGYTDVIKYLGALIDDTFDEKTTFRDEDPEELHLKSFHYSNQQFKEQWLERKVPLRLVFNMLTYVETHIARFAGSGLVSSDLVKRYLETIVRNWDAFKDVISYVNDLKGALSVKSIEHNPSMSIPMKNYIIQGDADIVINENVLVEVKCCVKNKLAQWSRQLHMYSIGLAEKSGKRCSDYKLVVVNLYLNKIMFLKYQEGFGKESLRDELMFEA